MAELAGSIIGIVSAGTKVALVLSQLAADMGSAGQEARMISSEIRTFCTILNTLKDTLEKIQYSSYYAHCFDVVQGITAASIDMFTEVLDAAETLKTMATGKLGRDGKFNFVNKIQWVVFQKPKIVVLRAAIEAYKSNIAMMLGTINVVEKVARRSSNPFASSTVIEDDQEQATLEGLNLDCRSSMISLEQAERQYKEYITKQDPSLDLEHSSHDLSINSVFPGNDESHADSDDPQISLLLRARRDVKSIRSSLKGLFDEEESLQARLSRHSQRLSMLMAEDHKRISQRWSRPANDDFLTINTPGHDQQDLAVQQKSIFHDQLGSLKHPEQQAAYVSFRDWLLGQPWSQQDEILEALRSATYSDRVAGGQIDVAGANLLASDEMIGGTAIVDAPHSLDGPSKWTQAKVPQQQRYDIVSAISEQIAVNAPGWHPVGSAYTGRGISLKMRDVSEMPEAAVELLNRKFVEALDLSWNRLHALPWNLELCSHLRFLNLGHNKLESFPESLLHLSTLVALDLRGNKIPNIPSAVSNLEALEILFLSDNKIQGLPIAIGIMHKLTVLDLHGNPIVFPARSALRQRTEPGRDPPRFDTKSTSKLKSVLKNYSMDQLRYEDAQAMFGTLPQDLLTTYLNSQPKWDHSRIDEATTIEEAMAFLRDNRKDIVEPSSDVLHEIPRPPIRPNIRIHKAGNSCVSIPAKQSVGHDHRRARSHDVSSSGSQSFATRFASSLHPSHDIWRSPSPGLSVSRAMTQERQSPFKYMPQFR